MAYVVGLTGGIGSGKSAAAEAFARRAVTVVDTDAIAHQLTGPGGAAMTAIREAFGEDYIAADGSLDRARMRHRVFTDPLAKQRLEALLHPLIREHSDRQLERSPGPYAILVVPLLVESGAYVERCQRILVVDCDETTQLARVKARGLGEDEIRRIMAAQASRTERLAQADDILQNDGSLADLDRKVEKLHQHYLACARGAVPEARRHP
ncbi:MAG: dephospho-CoA kinase [Betaproteobacteria bacterium RIFCSPLOWO2_12_FULL_66_14]|nr:MAG: dephospho-CoA kinase [Betaproteobacteria bacterium RIFCSPLOWO2_12_FULL_66_14]